MASFIYRWNIDRAFERGLIEDPHGGYYEHYLVEEIQEMIANVKRKKNGMVPLSLTHIHDVHASLKSTKDYEDTKERFFMPWIRKETENIEKKESVDDERSNVNLQSDDDSSNSSVEIINDEAITSTLRFFEAQRVGLNWPRTKVMKCEHWLFDELLPMCGTRSTNNDVYTSIDFSEMTNLWNERVQQELTCGAPTLSEVKHVITT